MDQAFTEDERQAIEAAAAEWVGAIPVALTLDAAPCDKVVLGEICIVRQDDETFNERAPVVPAPRHVLAYTDTAADFMKRPIDGAVIYVNEHLIDSRFQKVVAHELGHAMGLHHTGPGTLMAPDIDEAAAVPTCTDLLQWTSLRGVFGRCIRKD